MDKLILASKSVVRKKILHDNNIQCEVIPSKLDEGPVKEKLIMSKANPNKIAKNLASLKAKKVSEQFINRLVLGADSVIDLNGELISKPKDREEALNILKKLNGKVHYLISSVSMYKNGQEIWNYTDQASLTMKNFTDKELINYLSKIKDNDLYAYNVYQIEGEGRGLFHKIEGDENTVMGLPVNKIKEYINNL
jgi:septum formation protein|tara:strand:+ start:3552 stop:4133 length:582 start_codon:yes stop_codon:yes gene_type:complete